MLRSHTSMAEETDESDGEDGASPLPALGQSIGRFELVEFIGEGSSGQVFRARQVDPARDVAIKLLWPTPGGSPALGSHEGAMLAGLEHPGIARLYEVGVWEQVGARRAWIAMEFVRQGRPLDALSVGALDIRTRVGLMIEVARAVAFANGKGIIHRDLKPGNVLVNADSHPVVIDFGLARVADANAHSVSMLGKRVVGTLGYLAPESVTPGAPPSVRGDVFALGAMLYECLAQRPMRQLDGQSIPQALHTVLHAEPPRLSTVDRAFRGDLDRIVARATARNPSQRYASADALADDLERHLIGQPVLIEQQSRSEQLLRAIKRHWQASAIAAFVLVTLVATTLISLRFAQAAEHEARIATLAAAARALDANDQLLMARALDRLADDSSLEVAVLRRASNLGGTLVTPNDTYAVSLAPNGAWLAAAYCAPRNGEPGAGLMRVDDAHAQSWDVHANDSATNGTLIDPSGKLIAQATSAGSVQLRSSEDGRLIWSDEGRPSALGDARAVGWTDDGRLLMAGGPLEICDASKPDSPIATIPLDIGAVRCIATGPNNLVGCVGHTGAVVVDLAAGAVVQRLEVPAAIQSATCWTSDGALLLVGGWDSTVRAYRPDSPKPVWTGRVHSDSVWAICRWPEGRMCSTGAGGRLAIWDPRDGTSTVIPISPDVVWAVATDNATLWTGSLGGLRKQEIEVVEEWGGARVDATRITWTRPWNASIIASGGIRIEWHDQAREPKTIGESTRFRYLAGDSEGHSLLAITAQGVIIRFDPITGSQVWSNDALLQVDHAYGAGGLAGVAVDGPAKRVVIASRSHGCVALSLANGSQQWTSVFGKECAGVGVHEGGEAVYASDRDGLVVRLDPSTGRELARVKRDRTRIGALCMDSSGERLLAGGGDGTIRVLDPRTLEELLSLRVSRVTIDSLWGDNGLIWSIDRAGMKRWR